MTHLGEERINILVSLPIPCWACTHTDHVLQQNITKGRNGCKTIIGHRAPNFGSHWL